MRENMTIQNLYDLRNTMARPLLENLTYPWEALPLIGAFIVELGKTLSPDDYELRGENIWVAKSAKLYPNIYIAGPAIIGPNTEVRPGAFIVPCNVQIGKFFCDDPLGGGGLLYLAEKGQLRLCQGGLKALPPPPPQGAALGLEHVQAVLRLVRRHPLPGVGGQLV